MPVRYRRRTLASLTAQSELSSSSQAEKARVELRPRRVALLTQKTKRQTVAMNLFSGIRSHQEPPLLAHFLFVFLTHQLGRPQTGSRVPLACLENRKILTISPIAPLYLRRIRLVSSSCELLIQYLRHVAIASIPLSAAPVCLWRLFLNGKHKRGSVLMMAPVS